MLSPLARAVATLSLTTLVTFSGGIGAWGHALKKQCPQYERVIPAPIDSWNAGALSSGGAQDTNGSFNGAFVGGVGIDPNANTQLPGLPTSAFQFDGSTGFINMGPDAGDFGQGDFSLEAWFYWDGRGSSVGNIIRKSNYPAGGNGAGYWIRILQSSSTLEFFVGEPVTGSPGASLVTPVTPGEWHHVVGTRSQGTIVLYLDGVRAAAISSGSGLTPGFDVNSTALFTVGAWSDRFGPTEFFSGEMFEASLYSAVLTDRDVEALFYLGTTGHCFHPLPVGVAGVRG